MLSYSERLDRLISKCAEVKSMMAMFSYMAIAAEDPVYTLPITDAGVTFSQYMEEQLQLVLDGLHDLHLGLLRMEVSVKNDLSE